METPGVLDAYVAIVPGFELVAGFVLARRIGEDEAVLGGVILQPPRRAGLAENGLHLVGRHRVREVHSGAELVLAVPRRRLIASAPEP